VVPLLWPGRDGAAAGGGDDAGVVISPPALPRLAVSVVLADAAVVVLGVPVARVPCADASAAAAAAAGGAAAVVVVVAAVVVVSAVVAVVVVVPRRGRGRFGLNVRAPGGRVCAGAIVDVTQVPHMTGHSALASLARAVCPSHAPTPSCGHAGEGSARPSHVTGARVLAVADGAVAVVAVAVVVVFVVDVVAGVVVVVVVVVVAVVVVAVVVVVARTGSMWELGWGVPGCVARTGSTWAGVTFPTSPGRVVGRVARGSSWTGCVVCVATTRPLSAVAVLRRGVAGVQCSAAGPRSV